MPLLHLIQDLSGKGPGEAWLKGMRWEGGRDPTCEPRTSEMGGAGPANLPVSSRPLHQLVFAPPWHRPVYCFCLAFFSPSLYQSIGLPSPNIDTNYLPGSHPRVNAHPWCHHIHSCWLEWEPRRLSSWAPSALQLPLDIARARASLCPSAP